MKSVIWLVAVQRLRISMSLGMAIPVVTVPFYFSLPF